MISDITALLDSFDDSDAARAVLAAEFEKLASEARTLVEKFGLQEDLAARDVIGGLETAHRCLSHRRPFERDGATLESARAALTDLRKMTAYLGVTDAP
ncbi:MAG TPA: hypothetical protein VMF32_25425 [Xanthobacteraceae bacterium]|nr:hypothetical protein [Xanthobacteraceae bacterium]